MASYETYGGNFILPHPYEVKKVTGYGVALDGDRAKLQALVDANLNRSLIQFPRYILVSHTVLFTFMDMGCMECAGHPQNGSFSERELNVALLLAAVDPAADDRPRIRLVWYMPYLWLDSGPALIAGRDIYGFPKQIADVTIPQLGQTANLSATADVLCQRGSAATPELILSMKRVPAGILQKLSIATVAADAIGILLESVLHLPKNPLANLGLTLPPIHLDSLRMAFMRQLPSILNFKRACFRSVAEVPFTVTLRSAGLLDGPYEVSIPWHHSVSLVDELGLGTAGADLKKTAKAAYHMDFDFILGTGQDLWVEHEP